MRAKPPLAGPCWPITAISVELLDLICRAGRAAGRVTGRIWNRAHRRLWRPRYAPARVYGLLVRWHLRKPAGPGRWHPESMGDSPLLDPDDEDALGDLDAELWPGDADRGVLPDRYRHVRKDDEDR